MGQSLGEVANNVKILAVFCVNTVHGTVDLILPMMGWFPSGEMINLPFIRPSYVTL